MLEAIFLRKSLVEQFGDWGAIIDCFVRRLQDLDDGRCGFETSRIQITKEFLAFGTNVGIRNFGDGVRDLFVVQDISGTPIIWRPWFGARELVETDKRLLSSHDNFEVRPLLETMEKGS